MVGRLGPGPKVLLGFNRNLKISEKLVSSGKLFHYHLHLIIKWAHAQHRNNFGGRRQLPPGPDILSTTLHMDMYAQT